MVFGQNLGPVVEKVGVIQVVQKESIGGCQKKDLPTFASVEVRWILEQGNLIAHVEEFSQKMDKSEKHVSTTEDTSDGQIRKVMKDNGHVATII